MHETLVGFTFLVALIGLIIFLSTDIGEVIGYLAALLFCCFMMGSCLLGKGC